MEYVKAAEQYSSMGNTVSAALCYLKAYRLEVLDDSFLPTQHTTNSRQSAEKVKNTLSVLKTDLADKNASELLFISDISLELELLNGLLHMQYESEEVKVTEKFEEDVKTVGTKKRGGKGKGKNKAALIIDHANVEERQATDKVIGIKMEDFDSWRLKLENVSIGCKARLMFILCRCLLKFVEIQRAAFHTKRLAYSWTSFYEMFKVFESCSASLMVVFNEVLPRFTQGLSITPNNKSLLEACFQIFEIR